jgi:Tfp pilus assembly protein PilV
MHGRLNEAMCSVNVRGACIRGNGPKAARRRRGLSIIEVAMASALLVVAMVPILKSLTKAHMFTAMIEEKTQSLVLAQGKLDEIKARSIYNFGSSGSFTDNNTFPGTSYVYNITDEDTPDPNLKQITVSVGYDGDNSVTLATYIARRW